jgi:hypothetical protein
MTNSSYSPVHPTPKSDLWVVTNFNPIDKFPRDLRHPRTGTMIYESLETAWEAADEANKLLHTAITATANPEVDLTEPLQQALTTKVSEVNEQTLRGLIHHLVQNASYKEIKTVISSLSEEDRQNIFTFLLQQADTRTFTNAFHDLNQNKNTTQKETTQP